MIGRRAAIAAVLAALGAMALGGGCRREAPGTGAGGAAGDPAAARRTITVFAAASTTELVTALARQLEAERGITARLSFAASSMLAQQIEQGAKADLFVSASEQWMDQIESRGLLEPGSRRDVLANRLVLVAPRDTSIPRAPSGVLEASFDLPAAISGRVAIGDPAHVPAGIYGAEALQSMGWWGAIQPRLAPALDVRAALQMVEIGAVDAGIVYASDARASDRVTVIGAFPPDAHGPIRYPAALVRGADPAARTLLEAMTSARSRELIVRHGFEAVSAAP
jgi:molybdate transport system substrate-binding protein